MATGKIKFGTDGFRGIIARDFTFENVKAITWGIIKYLFDSMPQKRTIIIGYDGRFMADEFANYTAEILKNSGFKVLLSDKICPTPVVAYMAKTHKDSAGAVMLTASHNPKIYLGIKFIPNYGGPANKEITDEIVKNIESDYKPEQKSDGEVILCDFREQYFSHLEKLIDFEAIKKANVKFIYDGLYSASIGFFDAILKKHGVAFESFNTYFDPNFGGGLPEPKPKFMKNFKNGYITFANDGDADRYGVIDEKGNWVSPNVVLAILLKYLVENKKKSGKMIITVGVSALVEIVAKKLNIETITTAVGFKWICDEMRKNPAILAGEDSGGLSTGEHIPEKDGVFANLLILEMLSKTGKTLFELEEDIVAFAECNFFSDRVDVKLNSNEQMKEIQEKFAALDKIADSNIIKTLKIDGIKFYLSKTDWVLMRPSGTEPLLRFYIESGNEKNLNKIKEFVIKNT